MTRFHKNQKTEKSVLDPKPDKSGFCILGTKHDGGKALFIALTMEAVQTCETLVYSYQSTRRYKPEESRHHTHRHDNIKLC
jgi:hypothetical protein